MGNQSYIKESVGKESTNTQHHAAASRGIVSLGVWYLQVRRWIVRRYEPPSPAVGCIERCGQLERTMKNLSLKLLFLSLAMSCTEVKTSDPNAAYKYWSGLNPPNELNVIKGQYWQSAHWSKEYITYLKLRPTENWWKELVLQNQLKPDFGGWIKPSDTPNWFEPSENSIRYSSKNDFDQGSRYFIDTLTGDCYIYEIRL